MTDGGHEVSKTSTTGSLKKKNTSASCRFLHKGIVRLCRQSQLSPADCNLYLCHVKNNQLHAVMPVKAAFSVSSAAPPKQILRS